ncbi:MAG: DsrE family protein [Desulforhopalus sp.]
MVSKIQAAAVIIFFALSIHCLTPLSAAEPINNDRALKNVSTPKSIFDIDVGDAEKLLLFLNVIKRTYDDLSKAGFKPDFILAFRGSTVRLLTSETWSLSEDDVATIKKISAVLKEIQDMGPRLEVCSVATELYKIDNETILPELTVVGNTFVSLIGYQNKGYALVPVH